MLEVHDTAHVHEDDLELYVRGRLEPRHTSLLESHLLECQSCRQRLSESIGLKMPLQTSGVAKQKEKYERSELRFGTGDEAIVQELNPLSLERHKVRIVDISRTGLGILAPKPSLPGTVVQIRIKDTTEVGEVRHCSPSGDGGYRIGLRLHTPL